MMKNNSSCNDVASSNMFSEESDTPVVHLSALNKYWNAKCLAFNQEKRDEQNQLRLVNVSPETLAWNRIALQQHILG